MKVTKKTDKQLKRLKQDVKDIREYYQPRREFTRWSQSQAGREWKLSQWKKQKECCAICEEPVEIEFSHIDHIKPISQYPDLTLDLKNLRITHPSCNLAKGDSDN